MEKPKAEQPERGDIESSNHLSQEEMSELEKAYKVESHADSAQETIGNEPEITNEDSNNPSEPEISNNTQVDSKEGRLRRLERASELEAVDNLYNNSSDDFLRSVGLPEKKHIEMYKKMIEEDDQAIIRNHDLTKTQKEWHSERKADSMTRLAKMERQIREPDSVRQHLVSEINKQRREQQNGRGIVNRLRGRFQAWSLGRKLKGFDANVAENRQRAIQEKSDFYQ